MLKAIIVNRHIAVNFCDGGIKYKQSILLFEVLNQAHAEAAEKFYIGLH